MPKSLVSSVLAVAMVLSLAVAAAPTAQAATTVTGTVVAVDWDENGNVIAVAIDTKDDEEYLVVMDEVGSKLIELVGSEVRAEGEVETTGEGELMIRVASFTVLDGGSETGE